MIESTNRITEKHTQQSNKEGPGRVYSLDRCYRSPSNVERVRNTKNSLVGRRVLVPAADASYNKVSSIILYYNYLCSKVNKRVIYFCTIIHHYYYFSIKIIL